MKWRLHPLIQNLDPSIDLLESSIDRRQTPVDVAEAPFMSVRKSSNCRLMSIRNHNRLSCRQIGNRGPFRPVEELSRPSTVAHRHPTSSPAWPVPALIPRQSTHALARR